MLSPTSTSSDHRGDLRTPLNNEIEEQDAYRASPLSRVSTDDCELERGPEGDTTVGKIHQRTFRESVIGYLAILGLVAAWIAQSEVAQVLQTKMDYNKPYAIVWVNHSFMGVMLPAQMLYYYLFQYNTSGNYAPVSLEDPLSAGDGHSQKPFGRWLTDSITFKSYWQHMAVAHGLNFKRCCRVAFWLTVVYTLGDYVWYIALPHTSVGAGTCIFNTSAAFTYAFSVLLLNEPLKAVSVCGVLLALLGAAVTAMYPGTDNERVSSHHHTSTGGLEGPLADSDYTSQAVGDKSHMVVADVLVLLAAALYGIYEVFYKLWQPQANIEVVNTVAGMMGVLTVLVEWVVIPVLNAIPSDDSAFILLRWCSEKFGLPSFGDVGYLMANASLALGFNLFLLVGLAYSSPVLVSTGCMLTIPLSRLTDWLLYGDSMSPLAYVGSALVVLGFAALTYADMQAHVVSR